MARPRLAHFVDIESRTASNSKATGGSSEVSLFHRSASVTHQFLVHQATTKFLCQGRHLYQCPAASNKCSGTLSGDFRDLFGRSARLSCQLAIVCSSHTFGFGSLFRDQPYRTLSLFSAEACSMQPLKSKPDRTCHLNISVTSERTSFKASRQSDNHQLWDNLLFWMSRPGRDF